MSSKSFLNPLYCQFYTKKGYYSKERNDDIVVDISVESYSEGATEWSLLLVIECKDYQKSIPVDEIEEFVAKLDQITGKNVKGVFISRSNYQKSAIEYARSKGIALVRMLHENQVEWILRRTPSAISITKKKEFLDNEIIEALTVYDFKGESEFLFGCVNNTNSTSITEILNNLIGKENKSIFQKLEDESSITQNTPDGSPIVPFIGQEEIENYTLSIINHCSNRFSTNRHVDLIAICHYITEKYHVKFIFGCKLGIDASGREILGKILSSPTTIYVSDTLEEDSPRWRFTVAHEIGHLILHQSIDLASIISTYLETDRSQSITILDQEPNMIGRLEWQANAFASCLLMPRDRLYEIVVSHLLEYKVNNYTFGIIYLDDQPCNYRPFNQLISKINLELHVSKQAAEYRIAQLRLLNPDYARRA